MILSQKIRILSIETSCDETAISILSIKRGFFETDFEILSNKIASQIELHAKYGGVFPAMAKREHAKNIVPLLVEALTESSLTSKSDNKKDLNKIKEILHREEALFDMFEKQISPLANPGFEAISVTNGPGLEPTLWVGINFARALGELWNIPVVPTNHMEGHIFSFLPEKGLKSFKLKRKDFKFPAVSLLVSGGHTEIVLVKNFGKYDIIGKTKDDAVGEAFDKVARVLGLPYPGGPEISRLAKIHRESGLPEMIKFPRPMIHSHDFDFSYSGLKTAVRNYVEKNQIKDELDKQKIARAFEDSAVEVLVHKTKKVIEKYKPKILIVGGGVSANRYLREQLEKEIGTKTKIVFPRSDMTGDNALMIGIAGGLHFMKNKKSATNIKLVADGNLELN